MPEALGQNCPQLVFRPQTTNVRVLGSENFFHIKLHKILHQISSYFQILGPFWQSYECLFLETCKNTLQKSSFLCHFRYVRSLYVFLSKKTPFFGALKFQYLRNRLDKFKKWAHSDILSLRVFKWCKNQIILIKF